MQADAIADLIDEHALSLAVLSPPRQARATIEAIFNFKLDLREINARLAIFEKLNAVSLPKAILCAAPNFDWLKKVAQDFPPLRIGRWTIHGALHRDKVVNRLLALQIDATNAFGTGEHPTTHGSLLILDKILKGGFRPIRMVDIGCGSGILAMGCVRATQAHAVAIDLDQDSVQIAANNIRANGLSSKIRVGRSCGYAATLVRKHAPYNLIMANIFARPLCRMAHDLKNNLSPGGIAILSGMLTVQANSVIAVHRAQGLTLVEHVKIGEWSVLALKRLSRA